MTALAELRERVLAASGPDAALSRSIQKTAGWHQVEPRHARNKHGAWISPQDWLGEHGDGSPILDGLHGTAMHRDPPDVTASVDAAFALVERMLPGWVYGVDPHENGCIAYVGFVAPNKDDDQIFRGRAATLALAILAAALSALIAQKEAI
jgi:hypothetical protein